MNVVAFKVLLIALLGLSALGPQQLTQSGAISGRLLGDGKPLPGTYVELQLVTSSDGEAGQHLAKERTDGEGRFRFEGLPAGRFRIIPHALGWMMLRETFSLTNARFLTLGEGESRSDIEINLIRGGVITGKILQRNGRPAIDQGVSLDVEGEIRYVPLHWHASTDDRGIYRVFGVPPGRYKVYAGTPTTYYPGVTEEREAEEIEVRPGAEIGGIDFRLAAAERRVTVSGRVIAGDTGAHLARAEIIARGEGRDGKPAGHDFYADENGEFHWLTKPGRYRLLTVGDHKIYGQGDPVEIEVDEKGVSEVELKAGKGGALSGQIVYQGPPDSKLSDFLSVGRLTIEIRNEELGYTKLRHIEPDKDGRFRVFGLAPGIILFDLNIGSEVAGWTLVDWADRASAKGKLVLHPGEEISDSGSC